MRTEHLVIITMLENKTFFTAHLDALNKGMSWCLLVSWNLSENMDWFFYQNCLFPSALSLNIL